MAGGGFGVGNDVVDTEFGFTRVSQINRFGQQLYRDGLRSLTKSIRTLEVRVAEHEAKIALAVRTGEGFQSITHWAAEIVNFRGQIAAAKFVIEYGAVF